MDDVVGVGCNGGRDGLFTVIGTTYSDPLLAGFMKFHRTEARLIKLNNCKLK